MRKPTSRARWLRPMVALSMIGLFIPEAAGRAEAGGVTCFGRTPTILGTAGDDRLRGTSRGDVIAGLGGDDVINGSGGNDYLCGFAGNDRVLGGAGGDALSGDANDDAIVGGAGRDYLLGQEGDDSIDGGQGKDIASWWGATTGVTANLSTNTATGQGSDSLKSIEGLEGGQGDDFLTGDEISNWFALGFGDDHVDGGGSLRDYVSYYYAKEGVSVDLAAGVASGEGSDVITGIEGVYGSKYDDTIVGDDQANWIQPGAGNDLVDGAGDLEVEDIVDYTDSKTGVTVDLLTGTASGNGTDSLTGIEGVRGSSGNDTITAENSGDELVGGAGDDKLFGGEGNDNLIGDAGNDTLVGGDGADGLFGMDGDDTLDGGNGFDTVYGGYGDDVCSNGEDTLSCESERYG